MTEAENRSLDGVLASLGARSQWRPWPRVGVTFAAAGAVLAVVGVLTISGDQATSSDGSFNRAPGIFLCGAVLVVALLSVARARSGPLASAGVAASVLALPALMVFLTASSRTGSVNFNAILLVSGAGYIAAYLLGPTRGHTFYLAAAVIVVWVFALHQVRNLGRVPESFIQICIEGECEAPDTSGWGVMSLAFTAGYLVVARILDRRGRSGAATPFVFGGLAALVFGIISIAREAGTAQTSVGVMIAGAVVVYLGATSGRRGMAWLGGGGLAIGTIILIGEIVGNDATNGGLFALGAGTALIAFGTIVVTRWNEPDELAPGPSTFVSPPPGPPPPPPAPPAPPLRRRGEPLRPPGR